ncbi:AraC family transcriptional regulator ligand-binding domain-containing protein [Nocardia sp. NPDC059240]|uniref:AraC family transcriptional regulator ligand-binding domain-containing protein n=1 Tax=Nocardia sp. NPDC059240 TaxID=3346786 RepID=UPI0036C961CA
MTGSDSVLLARFVLRRARTMGLNPLELARAAGVGPGALDGPPGSLPGQCYPRLWELFERRIDSAHVGLLAARRYGMGELGMTDYLLSTAATVGEGLCAAGEFGSRMSSARRLQVAAETDRHLTLTTDTASDADSRGAELAAQASFAFLTARARFGAQAAIVPAAITFRQRAPRHHAPFLEFFGTSTIEFGAAANSLTLRRADLDRPQHSANPGLAAVLRRGARATVLPEPPARAWADLVAAELDSARIGAPTPHPVTLDDMARHLNTSTRTLQRRLAAAGTGWHRELASARMRAGDGSS